MSTRGAISAQTKEVLSSMNPDTPKGEAPHENAAINSAITADAQILVARPPNLVRTTDGAHTLTIGTQAVVEGFNYRAVAEGSTTLLQALRQAGGHAARRFSGAVDVSAIFAIVR